MAANAHISSVAREEYLQSKEFIHIDRRAYRSQIALDLKFSGALNIGAVTIWFSTCLKIGAIPVFRRMGTQSKGSHHTAELIQA